MSEAQAGPPKGLTYDNPLEVESVDSPINFGNRPFLWIKPKNGEITKAYRSFSDYCDD